ncbi:MAG: VanZ family protein [Verrucomicrobiota bacterium]
MNHWKQKLKLRLPALILLAATILFWSLYDRYEPDGPVLLESPELAGGTNLRGDVSGSNGRFILLVPPGGKQARIDFPVPAAMDYESIRVRARIKVDGVVVGKYSWSCARLLVAQYDVNNKWIPGHHGLVSEKGSKDWAGHEDVFEISPKAARAVVVLQQSGTEGTAEYEHIEAQPVRIRASFIWWRIVFSGSWTFMALLYIRRCRLHRRKLKTLIVLNAIAILAGTLMPGEWIQDSAERFKATIRELRAPEPVPEQTQSPKKKPAQPQEQMDWFMEMEVEAHQAGHFILFATLCFLVYLSAALERQHPAYFFKVGADVLLFAAITESLQFLTLDRTAGIADLRIDLYGMATALLLFLMVLPFVRRFCAKPS